MSFQIVKNAIKASPLKPIVGPAYQYFQYLVFGELGLTCDIHSSVKLFDIADWIGVKPVSNEFFGYYDKTPWSPDGSKYITHHVPTGNDLANIVIYDQHTGTRSVVTKTSAWNYQQGAMTQWLSSDTILFNDIQNGQLAARMINISTNENINLPFPVQTVACDQREYLSLNYRHLDKVNPQYGYSHDVNNFDLNPDYSDSGLWKVNLDTRKSNLVVSLKDLQQIQPTDRMLSSPNWVNHAMYSPDGSRFVFMHRWSGEDGRISRLFVSNSDGTGLRLLLDNSLISHYSWLNEQQLIIWGRGPQGDKYYILDVDSGDLTPLPDSINEYGDGHPVNEPNGSWIVSDSYATTGRIRYLFASNLTTLEKINIGRFHSPISYRGNESCDLHPRWNRDGTKISIDSTHEGMRKNYILDVSSITDQ